jgi:hypothetical protein
MKCSCGGNATLQSNAIIYGRTYGNGMAFICDTCKGYVGCHNDGRPLGTIVDKETKELRTQIHALIDPLWKSGKNKRGTMYRMIAEELKKDSFHVGECDKETAKKVLKILPLLFKKLV